MFSRSFFPQVGGVEKHVWEICQHLASEENKITIFTEKFSNNVKDQEKINNIIVRRIKYRRLKIVGLLQIWVYLLKNRKIIKASDLIHVHDVFIWYLPFRLFYPKKRVYVTFHGWEGVCPIPRKNIFQKRLAAKLTRGNICIGEYIEKYYGLKADAVLYGGVNLPKKGLRKKKGYWVYVGRLEEDTGLPILLKALDETHGYEMHFCGDGGLRHECEKVGIVHGFCNPNIYLTRAEICFASGYLSILEGFSYRSFVFVCYDNALKKDYYSLTPFGKFLISSESKEEIIINIKNIKRNIKNIKKYDKLRERSYVWVKSMGWERAVNEYKRLWLR